MSVDSIDLVIGSINPEFGAKEIQGLFILENKNKQLIFYGDTVSVHEDLAYKLSIKHEDIIGGGHFFYSPSDKFFELFGSSVDFGGLHPDLYLSRDGEESPVQRSLKAYFSQRNLDLDITTTLYALRPFEKPKWDDFFCSSPKQ